MTLRVVRLAAAPTTTVVRVGGATVTGAVLITPMGPGVAVLDDLTDVSGTAVGAAGQVLTKQVSGQWQPATPAVAAMAYRHIQSAPVALWQVTHGLGFRPAGVVITDTLNGLVECDRITWPSDQVIELHFGAPLSGAVQLS